jgi:CRISPR-associated protein (TIGR02710 family)
MDSLTEMNDRLRRIFRGEEQYGEGQPAEQARLFRLTEILPATISSARRNSADVPRTPVDLLVSLSGFSPETTILAFELLRPERLMIISSESTRDSVDVIQEALRLPLSRIDVRYVDPVDPMKIYQLVQEAARTPSATDDNRAHVIIDITGGKKVMSASAALAAAQLDLPLCYIDSLFDPELRQSEPGTERLVIVPNPTTLFGDREMEAGLLAFRHGAYAAAHKRFTDVADTAYEPVRARFMRDLAHLYQAWCDLDFEALRVRVPAMRTRMSDGGHRVAAGVSHRIHNQLELLDTLSAVPADKREIPPMLLNFYLLGQQYERLGRHDFAALLFYRTLESTFAQRLARIAPGFRTDRPDYRLLGSDTDALLARYRAVTADVHGVAAGDLPEEVGLMNAGLLLLAVDDPVMIRLGLTTSKARRRFKQDLIARNKSVLAHGTATISSDVSKNLGSLALRAVRAFWQLEFGSESVDDRLASLAFVVDL